MRHLWESVITRSTSDEADRFDNMIEEYLFHHAMRAANSDSDHPEIACFMTPPHEWFGLSIPGSRWAGDSPDFIYRMVPIAHGGKYEIAGTPTCGQSPTVNYSLMSDDTAAPVTLSLLDSLDMSCESDGGFVITMDDTHADGRANHIQTKPGAEFLMIRDALNDWNEQSANQLTVRRLNPSDAHRGDDAMAQRAAKIAIQGVYYTYYCMRSGRGEGLNRLRAPQSSGVFGGMVSQWGSKGHLSLKDDEAMVVRCNQADALFSNLVLTDAFHMSISYWERTSSFNLTQMAPDEDGDFTVVIAHQDPGIHNWLDTGGLENLIFSQRWQAFSRSAEQSIAPWVTGRLVKAAKLDKELPSGVLRVNEAGRQAQLAARRRGVARRFREC